MEQMRPVAAVGLSNSVGLQEIDGFEAHLHGGLAEIVEGNLLIAPARDRLLDAAHFAT